MDNLQKYFPEPKRTGNTFFVDSNSAGKGTTNGYGFSPEAPFSTIAACIAAGVLTADNDDEILVCPKHAENVATAGGIALATAGVNIRGLGEGDQRGAITFITDNAASIDLSAARCSVKNLKLINGKDGQTAMINISAAGCVIEDNDFQVGDAATQAVLGILTTAGANKLQILNNYFHGTVDAGVTGCVRLVGGSDILVKGNEFIGAFAVTGALENVTTAGINHRYESNYFLNQTADANNKLITAVATTTGLIAGNLGGMIDSTGPAPVTAAAMFVAGNYFSSAAGVAAASVLL